MRLEVTRAIEEVRDRLKTANGWPSTVYINRGRVAVWEGVIEGGDIAANVLSGTPQPVIRAGSRNAPLVEYNQACAIEFLVHELDDQKRRAIIAKAKGAVLDTLTPRPAQGQRRETTLSGLVGELKIEGIDPDALANDTVPGLSGFRVRLTLSLTAPSIAGALYREIVELIADAIRIEVLGLDAGVSVNVDADLSPPTLDPIVMTALALRSVEGDLTVQLGEVAMAADIAIGIEAESSFLLAPVSMVADVDSDVGAQIIPPLSEVSFEGGLSVDVLASMAIDLEPIGVQASTSREVSGQIGVGIQPVGIDLRAAIHVEATADIQLAPVTNVALSDMPVRAESDIALADIEIVLEADTPQAAQVSFGVEAIGFNAGSSVSVEASVAIDLEPVSVAASASENTEADVFVALEAFGVSAALEVIVDGVIDATLEAVAFEAAVASPVDGAATVELAPFTVDGAVRVDLNADIIVPLDMVTMSAQAATEEAAAIVTVLNPIGLSAGLTVPVDATMAHDQGSIGISGELNVEAPAPSAVLLAHWDPVSTGSDGNGDVADLSGNGLFLRAYNSLGLARIRNWDGRFGQFVNAIGNWTHGDLSAFTYEFWVRDIQPSANGGESVFSVDDGVTTTDGSKSGWSSVFRSAAAGPFLIQTSRQGSVQLDNPAGPQPAFTEWMHFAMVQRASNVWNYYQNGLLVGSQTGPGHLPLRAGTHTIALGRAPGGSTRDGLASMFFFSGLRGDMSGVKLWEGEFSDAEMLAKAQNPPS